MRELPYTGWRAPFLAAGLLYLVLGLAMGDRWWDGWPGAFFLGFVFLDALFRGQWPIYIESLYDAAAKRLGSEGEPEDARQELRELAGGGSTVTFRPESDAIDGILPFVRHDLRAIRALTRLYGADEISRRLAADALRRLEERMPPRRRGRK